MRQKFYLSLLLLLFTGSLFSQTITFSDCEEPTPVSLSFNGTDYTGTGSSGSHYRLYYNGQWMLMWEDADLLLYYLPPTNSTIPLSCSSLHSNGWTDLYGCGISNFTLNAGADVSTDGATVNAGLVNLSGNVTLQGASTVTDKGFVYSTTVNPTILGNSFGGATGAGPFSLSIGAGALTQGTTYHVRAYATNSLGTTYGVDRSFTIPITVQDVYLQNTDPTNTTSVSFIVIFSGNVTGVTTSAFTLTTTGISGAVITGVSGSGSSYIVTANTGAGSGTLGLNINGSGITPTASNVPYTGPAYTIDKTPPTTTIVSRPPSKTNSAIASFTFWSSEMLQQFEQSLDGLPYSSAGSNFTTPSLADGSHTISVRAVDAAGNVDPNPVSYSWTVDTQSPPSPVVNTVANGATVSNNTPTYNGIAEPNSTVTIYVDGAPVGTTTAGPGGNWTFTQPTALANGAHTINSTATDAANNVSGSSNTNTFIISPISILTPSSNTAAVGISYNETLIASGGVPPYRFAITSGSLPAGLTLEPNGNISGTPTAGGTFNFTVQVTDITSNTASNSLSVEISPPAIGLQPPQLSDANEGLAYNATITAFGGTAPYTYSVMPGSSLPSGLTLSANGTLSGTPTVIGNFSFYIVARDASTGSGPYTGMSRYFLTINAKPVITFDLIPVKTYGNVDFALNATSDNTGTVISYTSSDPSVATIVSGNMVHIVGAGSTIITASQPADATHGAATDVPQMLTVNPAPLTITADNQSKVYGANIPSLTATYSGFVNGDNVSAITPATLSTTATASSNVNTYVITASGAANPNYTMTYVPGVLSVTPARLSIIAVNQGKIYGASVPTLTAAYYGFVGNDDPSDLSPFPTFATTATSSSDVGSYEITVSGAANPNYAIEYMPGNLNITPAVLTITADNQSKVYGAAIPSLTATYSGFVNGDNPSSLTTSPMISTPATHTSAVGNYAITVSGAIAPNYTINFVAGNISVTPASLTVRADDQTKVYGAAVPSLTATYSGFVNGDDASNLTTNPTINTVATSASPVGSYTVTASGAADPNYMINYAPGNLSVTPASLTITADDKSKVYGSGNPLLTVSYGGFVNGDDASGMTTAPTITTTATASSAAGNYTIAPRGAAIANYDINYADGNLSVTPAILTITADDKSKVYGTGNPLLSASYSGFVNGDDASTMTTAPTITTTATTSSAVGNYVVSASGAVNANYNINYTDGNLSVTPSVLTITADDKSKLYGAGNPSLTASYNGFVNGDDASLLTTVPTITTTATTSSAVGNYTITATGATSSNYTISYTNGNLSVTPATLIIGPDDKSKVYGTVNPALTVSYNGFVNGDDASSLTIAPEITTTATTSSAVGNYIVTAAGAANANYNISYANGNLSVTPAALTITADDKSKVYGTNNPSLSATYSGFVNGDDAGNLTTAPAITTVATTSSAVGNYTIVANGAVNANYNIGYADGNLSVTPAALTITADDKSKVYGTGNPALTVNYSGFVNGDNASSMTTAPAITTAATASSAVGNYVVTASGAVNTNYNISYVDGNLSVNPAALIITADDKSKVYGTGNPVLTVNYSGFVNGDNASSMTIAPAITTAATASSAVGNYGIAASGAVNPNYSISYADGNLSVTPATLTITADNKSKVYGTSNPSLTATYSGFVNNDDVSAMATAPTITTTATNASAAGSYTITANGAANANYYINYVVGNLSVTPAELTITADDKSKAYGAANPSLTFTYSGFVNGDDTASMTTIPTMQTAATTSSVAGNYTISAIGAANANYNINYIDGTLSVTPIALTITAENATKEYGSADPLFTYKATGWINGDDKNIITGNLSRSTGENVGNYTIVQNNLSAGNNYTIDYTGARMTVSPATLAINANAQTKVYGKQDPVLTYTSNGWKNGDGNSLITGSLARVAGENTGNYAIQKGSLNAGRNYNVTYNGADLTITKAPQVITWVQDLTIGCNEATSLKLTAASNSGLPVSYSISNNDIATISNNTLTPGQPGSTVITATQAGDNNHFPATGVTNTLINRSSASIKQHWSDVIVFDNSSNNFVQWQWYKNNNPVANTTRAYYSEPNSLNGEYYVIATDKTGNVVQSCPLTLTGSTTITGGIKVFPNPAEANSNVTVTCNYDDTVLQGARLAIMDPSGKVWQEITNVHPTQTIKAPSIQSIYYISLVLKSGQKVSVNLLVK